MGGGWWGGCKVIILSNPTRLRLGYGWVVVRLGFWQYNHNCGIWTSRKTYIDITNQKIDVLIFKDQYRFFYIAIADYAYPVIIKMAPLFHMRDSFDYLLFFLFFLLKDLWNTLIKWSLGGGSEIKDNYGKHADVILVHSLIVECLLLRWVFQEAACNLFSKTVKQCGRSWKKCYSEEEERWIFKKIYFFDIQIFRCSN